MPAAAAAATSVPPDPRADKPAGKPLSQREAQDLRGRLIDLLGGAFDDTDKLLTVTSATKREAHIWSTIDDQEIALLADTWISWGRKSARGAATVRTIVRQWRKYQVALILGPRFLETINFVAENGIASPTPAWRKQRQNQAPAKSAATAARPVPVVVDAAPSARPPASAPAPTPTPAPEPDEYARAEALQREHAARVFANRTLAAEAQNGAAVDVPSA